MLYVWSKKKDSNSIDYLLLYGVELVLAKVDTLQALKRFKFNGKDNTWIIKNFGQSFRNTLKPKKHIPQYTNMFVCLAVL